MTRRTGWDMDLDVLDSGQVTGHMVLRTDLGVLGRQMVVLSGIAKPGREVDDDAHTACSCSSPISPYPANLLPGKGCGPDLDPGQ